MTIIAADWSRRVQITEINTSPTLSGYVALLTESNLPAEIWTTAINGGGDLRVCLNSDGTGQLPLEVVSFDTVAETGVLWVRFPTFASGDSLWLFYGKAGETQPVVTDAFGRNSVWVDYLAVLHLNDTYPHLDSTGNLRGTIYNTGSSVPSVSGNPLGGNWADFDGVSTLLIENSADIFSGSPNITVQAIKNQDYQAGNNALISTRNTTAPTWFFIGSDSRVLTNLGVSENSTITSGAGLGVNTWTVMTQSSLSLKSIENGTILGEDTSVTGTGFGLSPDVRIGSYFDDNTVRRYNGRMAEVRISADELSVNTISTEYANQSSPATFWSTGTPEDTGEGGGLTIITSPIVSGEVVGSPTLTAGSVLISPVAIATAEAFGTSIVTRGATFINPITIPTEELVGQPIITPQGVLITPVAIATEEVVGEPTLVTGVVIVLPNGIPTQEEFGENVVDTILKQIFPQEILSLEDFGTSAVLGGDSIIIPVPNRVTWNAVAKYLRELSGAFSGADNDVIMKWLGSEGFEGNYNDRFNKYLIAQGFLIGTLTDKKSEWEKS